MLKNLEKFGIDKFALCRRNLGVEPNEITENVVIAPFYKAESFADVCDANVEKLFEKYYKTYKISKNGKSFIYINSNMGAGNIAEIVSALSVTNCKNIYFIGSAGSVVENINIGELALPSGSIIGDGTCRYFNDGIENFLEVSKPDTKLFENVKIVLKKLKLKFHITQNFSVDTIVGQYLIMDKILETKANTLEMETSALFYIAKKLGLKAVAIHNISDSSIKNKSLFAGRIDKEMEMKKYTQNIIIPQILAEILLK